MAKRLGHCKNPICQRQFQAHYIVREIAFLIGYETLKAIVSYTLGLTTFSLSIILLGLLIDFLIKH